MGDLRTGRLVWQATEHMPNTTNNEAEWRGLLLGLRAAVQLGAYHVSVGGDSKLILEQLLGESRVEEKRLTRDFVECRMLLSRLATMKANHYRRGKNKAADALANIAADGVTDAYWADGKPVCADTQRRHRSDIPDIGTCLLGVERHARKAVNEKPVSWFQVIRLSALRRIYESRTSARVHSLDEDAVCIKRRISRDFLQRVQLRLAAKKPCGSLKLRSILPIGLNPRTISSNDFFDIAAW